MKKEEELREFKENPDKKYIKLSRKQEKKCRKMEKGNRLYF